MRKSSDADGGFNKNICYKSSIVYINLIGDFPVPDLTKNNLGSAIMASR
jgi:hypothetical protein